MKETLRENKSNFKGIHQIFFKNPDAVGKFLNTGSDLKKIFTYKCLP